MIQRSVPRLIVFGVLLLVSAVLLVIAVRLVLFVLISAFLIVIGGYLLIWAITADGQWCRRCKKFPAVRS